MAKSIQDLRREAGYKSAKDFAAAMGIALSTYNRYENQPDAIPLKQAWAIADFLGCSIDMVVGREPVSVEDMRGDVQKFYDGLSAESRELMDDHMDWLAHREKKAAKKARKAQRRRYQDLLQRYMHLYMEQVDESEPFGITIEYDPEARRSGFERYLTATAAAKRDSDIRVHLRGMEEELREGYLDKEGRHHDFPEDEIQRSLAAEEQAFVIEYEPRDREVIEGIMEAYDEQSEDLVRSWRMVVHLKS